MHTIYTQKTKSPFDNEANNNLKIISGNKISRWEN